MNPEPEGRHDSLAILVGVSRYDDPAFTPVAAARNSLSRMKSILADPALCGWSGEIRVIPDPTSQSELALTISELAEQTRGVLLLYYVGHGLLSPRGELCLTVTTTNRSRPTITGVPWEDIAEALRGSPARMRIAILDCCFAGQAIEALAGDAVADIVHVEGIYTLTATTRNRTAHVPPPEEQEAASTSFTAELTDLISSGIPYGPSALTLGAIYPVLRNQLSERGLPRPNQRGTDLADRFVFARNAWHPGANPPEDRDTHYGAVSTVTGLRPIATAPKPPAPGDPLPPASPATAILTAQPAHRSLTRRGLLGGGLGLALTGGSAGAYFTSGTIGDRPDDAASTSAAVARRGPVVFAGSDGYLFFVTDSWGGLRQYRRKSPDTGATGWAKLWQNSRSYTEIGSEFQKYSMVFTDRADAFYGVLPSGVLHRYRLLRTWPDGRGDWPNWGRPTVVHRGFRQYSHVFAASDRQILAVTPDGRLDWYRLLRINDIAGTFTWANNGKPRQIGEGFHPYSQVFWGDGDRTRETPDSVLAVTPDGRLARYQLAADDDPTRAPRLADNGAPTTIAEGFDRYTTVTGAPQGVIYAARDDGLLYWYRLLAVNEETRRPSWANNGKPIQIADGFFLQPGDRATAPH
ncbi:tachylectin-related carbohydrate-binding protein [Streptomyces sp. NPDC020898]|uniref:caspase, EACC1-associated type n=1 Tax=Streptomyces sp. NPDC020898 TaxID=3365101 RepID=UPI00379DD1EE